MSEKIVLIEDKIHISALGRTLCGDISDQLPISINKFKSDPNACSECLYQWGILSTTFTNTTRQKRKSQKRALARAQSGVVD